MSPELPTHDELRAIDRMIDTDIDFAVEEKHLSTYKGETCMACESGELDENDTCSECGTTVI